MLDREITHDFHRAQILHLHLDPGLRSHYFHDVNTFVVGEQRFADHLISEDILDSDINLIDYRVM